MTSHGENQYTRTSTNKPRNVMPQYRYPRAKKYQHIQHLGINRSRTNTTTPSLFRIVHQLGFRNSICTEAKEYLPRQNVRKPLPSNQGKASYKEQFKLEKNKIIIKKASDQVFRRAVAYQCHNFVIKFLSNINGVFISQY